MQVAVNDLIILAAFVPIVSFLLGVTNIFVPWDTLILSIVLFVVVPLAGGFLTRYSVVKNKGEEYFTEKFIPKFDSIKTAGLLLTLIIIFSFQDDAILENPLHVLLIAVPLILQNVLTAAFAYWMCKVTKQPHNVAAPAALIGASDFFELSVAVAFALFGPTSPVVLVCTVGVLTEGTETKPQINQDALRLMRQLYGIDMEKTLRSKLLSEIPPVDIVITMGCNVQCPFLPCKYREDWGLHDPSGKEDDEFIAVIHKIESKIGELITKIIAKQQFKEL